MRLIRYIIPSIFSLFALLFSYYAVLESTRHDFIAAAYGVITAMIFDSLDGRSARLLKSSSKFGASLDSLVDMMAYGVAPSIMMYCWCLFTFGKIGYLLSFIMCACAGLRLARFNIMLEVQDKRFFQGLSSTMAGGFVVSFILSCAQYGWYNKSIMYIAAFIIFISAILMVSNLKFYSFKVLPGNQKISSIILLIVILGILSLLPIYKGLVVFATLTAYIAINLLLQPLYKHMPKKS